MSIVKALSTRRRAQSSRGLLRDIKTSRNLWEPLFEALLKEDLYSVLSDWGETSHSSYNSHTTGRRSWCTGYRCDKQSLNVTQWRLEGAALAKFRLDPGYVHDTTNCRYQNFL